MSRSPVVGHCVECGAYEHLTKGSCKRCYSKKYYREKLKPVVCKKDKKPKFSGENLRIYLEYKQGGITQAELARKYGKSRQSVSDLIRRIEKGL